MSYNHLGLHYRRQLLHETFKLIDLVIMVAALVVSFGIATERPGGFVEVLSWRSPVENFAAATGLLLIWHLSFAWCDLYVSRRFSSLAAEAFDVVKATSLATLVIFCTGVFLRFHLERPELFLISFWIFATGTSILVRLGLRAILERARRRGRNLRYVLIAGTNQRAIQFARTIESRPALGYRVAGFVDSVWDGTAEFLRSGGKLVSDLRGLRTYLSHHVVDEVVVALPFNTSYRLSSRIVGICEQQGITVRFVSQLFDARLATARVELFQDEPILTLESGPLEASPLLFKRLLDLTVSAGMLVVLSPLLLAVAAAIKLTSRGPVLFVQQRLAVNKRKFKLYKFRTMNEGAEGQQAQLEHLNEVSGPVFKIRRDPRVTPLGRFLRRWSIDELPQLWNVLRGDMSLVGPRPLPLRDFEGFEDESHLRRLSVRPGLTCLWQVRGRSSVPFEQWMAYDLEYIDRWSLWLDMKILWRTIPVVLGRRRGEFSTTKERPNKIRALAESMRSRYS